MGLLGFYTDKQGRTRPITAKKGSAGAAIAGVAAAAVLATGGGLGGAASVGGSAEALAASRSMATKVIDAKKLAKHGKPRAALRTLGLKRVEQVARIKRRVDRDLHCAIRSYGDVREFFLRNPCRSLRRELLPIADGNGDTMLVSVARVRMPSRWSAMRLKDLADIYGTGNVSPIARTVLARQGVHFTGRAYGARTSGPVTVIAEAATVSGRFDLAVLDGAAETFALLR